MFCFVLFWLTRTVIAILHIFDSLKKIVFFDVKNVGFTFNSVPEVIDKLYYPGTEQMDVLARSLLQDYQTTMDCLCFNS